MDDWREIAVTSDENSTFCACLIWDIRTGSEIVKIRQGITKSHCLSFIGDNYLICGSKDPKVLNVWALHKQVKIHLQIKCIASINALTFSPNGTYCVGTISSKLYVWRVNTGELISIITEHYGAVNCIKFDETESYFASGGEDRLCAVWSISNLINSAVSRTSETALTKPLHVWNDHKLEITDICISNRGIQPNVISVSRDRSCKIYNLHDGQCVFTIYTDEELYSVALDPLGCFVYLGTGTGAIIKTSTHSILKSKSANIKKNQKNDFVGHEATIITCLSVSSDGRYLLSGSKDTKAIIWNLSSCSPRHYLKHEGAVTNAFFRPYPRSLDQFEHISSKLLIKPFQFVVSAFNNEEIDVILPSRKRRKNGIKDSMLDRFFEEDEVLPTSTKAMEQHFSMFNSQNTKLYKQTQILNLLK